ncbi:DNA alkylation repair enzyme [Kribbella flavida DSM 17836]|uniref:DNA alkylation repair enzyme n=1 Tax=Kribbella flavida (strain DSM 17836 / JCM 10339 / NBRC 14399) TaxID=479435 RepID=D2PXF7_KRIFD|nr:DNA alkylation repair protein [Kribbella flavida]ADB29805.1 DNA alkylation repair enzyme [Kribbella flavida DSM 17836]
MTAVGDLLAEVDAAGDPDTAEILARYFQVKPGGYGEGDRFIGVKLSTIRALLKPHLPADLPLADLEQALHSPVHEHRLAVLCVLAYRATRARRPRTTNPAELTEIHTLYLRNTARVNNWDLVDCSAAQIVGGYLADRPRDVLHTLIRSPLIWDRRIALIATHHFIRSGDATDLYALVPQVLDDPEDLIHKAAGWMLRETGARVSSTDLRAWLDLHAPSMPRTMLRYAVQHFPAEDRKHYLTLR